MCRVYCARPLLVWVRSETCALLRRSRDRQTRIGIPAAALLILAVVGIILLVLPAREVMKPPGNMVINCINTGVIIAQWFHRASKDILNAARNYVFFFI